MGGDEFYLLLSNTTYNESIIIVKKLQNKLKHSKFIYGNIELEISASFGSAQYKVDGYKIEDLVKIADERMYKNKEDKR